MVQVLTKTIVIVGKTGSGKSTSKRRLVKHLQCESILEHTNRPLRPGEADGVDYIFSDTDAILKQLQNQEFVACTNYATVYGDWYYGILREDLIDGGVLITNPDNLRQLLNSGYPASMLYIVYLDVDETARANVLIKRGDNAGEVYRRIGTEDKQFSGIKEVADLVIEAHTHDHIADDLVSAIMCEYTRGFI